MTNIHNIPKGFQFLGKHVGIKKDKKDFGAIVADTPCTASAVFTKNQFCGEPVPIGKKAVRDQCLQAFVVTSGIANVATGARGHENALKIVEKLASEVNIAPENILPSSTGMIGPQLPIETILNGMDDLKGQFSPTSVEDFATAILTTDKEVKLASVKIGEATLLGVAKGSGMIEPNMATMLVYLVSDAKIAKKDIYSTLKNSVDKSFNSMSIDTDTSTSDTVALMISNLYEVALRDFATALDEVCLNLCKKIVKDAEGAEHTIVTTVSHCIGEKEAKKIGKSIINSPLVKTAVYGADPNWGRLIMAIGKLEDITLDKDKLVLKIGEHIIFQNQQEVSENLAHAKKYLQNHEEIEIFVEMHTGKAKHTVYGCDLTEEYVHINGHYTT